MLLSLLLLLLPFVVGVVFVDTYCLYMNIECCLYLNVTRDIFNVCFDKLTNIKLGLAL